jgi:hypothetical protein
MFGLSTPLMVAALVSPKSGLISSDAFKRATYVHAANICLLSLAVFWQPINIEVWFDIRPSTRPRRES